MKIYSKLAVILVWVLLSYPLFQATSIRNEHHQIRLMTYNIKYDNPNDAENNWDKRKEHLIGLLQYHSPDLFGVQEALNHQINYIDKALPQFSYIGVGRDNGEDKGEYSAIYYNTTVFKLLDSGTFWLNETPSEIKKGWDAALPRICTWGKLKHKGSQEVIYYFNTHFDHVGVTAREESVKLILSQIAEKAGNAKVILSGDFNFTPETKPYLVITKKMKDTYLLSEIPHYGGVGTYNGFEFNKQSTQRIDYIFVNDGFQVLDHATLTDSYNLHYPSDHFPVVADLQF